jgi:hypothetical protein
MPNFGAVEPRATPKVSLGIRIGQKPRATWEIARKTTFATFPLSINKQLREDCASLFGPGVDDRRPPLMWVDRPPRFRRVRAHSSETVSP